jgi:hypothetical protein
MKCFLPSYLTNAPLTRKSFALARQVLYPLSHNPSQPWVLKETKFWKKAKDMESSITVVTVTKKPPNRPSHIPQDNGMKEMKPGKQVQEKQFVIK